MSRRNSVSNIVCTIILILMISSVFVPLYKIDVLIVSEGSTDSNKIRAFAPSYQESRNISLADDPVIIRSNSDFASQGWSGNGTELDPYLISDLDIEVDSTQISIWNTDAHFIIESCSLSSTSFAIELINVSNGTIANCTINEIGVGLSFSDCTDCTVLKTTITDCNWGISFAQSRYNLVNNCQIKNFGLGIFLDDSNWTVVENTQFLGEYKEGNGFQILDSSHCEFSNCLIEEADMGFEFYNSPYNEVDSCSIKFWFFGAGFWQSSHCSITNSVFALIEYSYQNVAIYIWDSEDITLEDCNLIDCRLDLSGSTPEHYQHTVNNVTSNSKEIRIFYGVTNLDINLTDYSQIFLVESSGCDLYGGQFANLTGGIVFRTCQDCSIENVTISGLTFYNSTNMRASNVTLVGAGYSMCVDISYSADILIEKSRMFSPFQAIITYESNSITFTDCKVTASSTAGSFYDTNNVSIIGSEFHSLYYGFYVMYCSQFIIDSSFLNSTGENLLLIECDTFVLQDSILLGNGIQISSTNLTHWIHTYSNVTLNGKPVVQYTDLTNTSLSLDNFGQLILVDCEDIQIWSQSDSEFTATILVGFSDTCEIFDFEFDSVSIFLSYCTYFGIQNISISDYQSRIYTEFCSNVQITDSTLNCVVSSAYTDNLLISNNTFGPDQGGIQLHECDFSDVSNNIIHAPNSWGIYIFGSEYVAVANNDIFGTMEGITIYYSDTVTVFGNYISETIMDGISAGGIQQCEFVGNFILDSGDNGIGIGDASYCTISFNYIANNFASPIEIYSSSDNSIFGNYIDSYGIDCLDTEGNNQWYSNQGIGNLWVDSLGASRITIPGDSGSADEFPLFCNSDLEIVPILSSPPDSHIEDMLPEDEIRWVIWTHESINFCLYENGVEIELGARDSSGIISFIPEDLTLSSYNYTLVILDGNTVLVSDTVFIMGTLEAPIGLYAVIVVSLGSIVVVLVALEIRKPKGI